MLGFQYAFRPSLILTLNICSFIDFFRTFIENKQSKYIDLICKYIEVYSCVVNIQKCVLVRLLS